jgi:hypothetical protein
MTAIILPVLLTVIVLALVVYGLERNHSRQPRPRPRLFGSTNFDDREPFRSPPVFSP